MRQANSDSDLLNPFSSYFCDSAPLVVVYLEVNCYCCGIV